MTIAKKPDSNSNQLITNANQITSEQKAFISGSKEQGTVLRAKTTPVMLRLNPDIVQRIDQAAKKRGLKRATFILSAAVQLADRILEE